MDDNQPLSTPLPHHQNTVKLKVLSIFALLVIALVGGAIPFCLVKDDGANTARAAQRRRRINRIVSVMNSFSGGVFMGIALIHLIPSARVLITDALAFHEESGLTAYPWTEFCASVGFFLILMVEQVILGFGERFGSSISVGNSSTFLHHTHGHGDCESVTNGEAAISNTDDAQANQDEENEGDNTSKIGSQKNEMAIVVLNAFVLLTALSIHSVLEGMALGLQLTRTATLDMLIALSLHKGIEAFTLSLSFVQTPASRLLKYVTFIVFGCTTPIGIAIGIPITSEENAEDFTMLLVNGILQGLATGSFIYVTFIELLPQELKAKGDRMLKFVVMLFGFGIIAAVTSLEFST